MSSSIALDIANKGMTLDELKAEVFSPLPLREPTLDVQLAERFHEFFEWNDDVIFRPMFFSAVAETMKIYSPSLLNPKTTIITVEIQLSRLILGVR